jgi:hypothetical protein
MFIILREERGANTEPTGLGMERWYVVLLISVPIQLTCTLRSEGQMAWDGVRVVSRLSEKLSPDDQVMEISRGQRRTSSAFENFFKIKSIDQTLNI